LSFVKCHRGWNPAELGEWISTAFPGADRLGLGECVNLGDPVNLGDNSESEGSASDSLALAASMADVLADVVSLELGASMADVLADVLSLELADVFFEKSGPTTNCLEDLSFVKCHRGSNPNGGESDCLNRGEARGESEPSDLGSFLEFKLEARSPELFLRSFLE